MRKEWLAFISRIESMWISMGRPASTLHAMHDWKWYYNHGYRADTAKEAFDDALSNE